MKQNIRLMICCFLSVLLITGTGLTVLAQQNTQPAPEPFTLTFRLNDDGESFTAVIPAVPNGLYSFDGVNYSGNNEKGDCAPNTEYTGFVKYAQTDSLPESAAVSDTKTSPMVRVKTPVVSPDVSSFKYNLTVSIGCETPDATIYYTLDGSVPTLQSKKYTGPFNILGSTYVRAIAVKSGYETSQMVTKHFSREQVNKRPASCKISFKTNGGSEIADQKIKRNTALLQPKNPEKEGYIFGGWYQDPSLTQAFDFNQKILYDTTLYAKWVQPGEDTLNQIVMQIGEKEMVVFGETVVNDVAPVKKNDRTMLPARFVAEHLGATVIWTEETQTATITKDDVVIILRVGEEYAQVNDKKLKLDAPVFQQNDRTYTPLRFISETLGATVDWIEESQQIIITKGL